MTIISSVAEMDERRLVREIHTDHTGLVFYYHWLAEQGVDPASRLVARAAELEAQQAAQEIGSNITAVTANGSLASLSFVYSTAAQNRAALRAAYLTATRTEAVMIGDFLGSLTDNQLQNLFGLTAGQVTTLRNNKLTPAASLATSIRAATGV